MFKNYFLICFRNIRKNKVFSFLNIAGLSIGIASCLTILQYTTFESRYDQFHKNKDRVFRIDAEYYGNGEYEGRSNNSAYKLPGTIKETVAGVSHFTRTHLQYGGAVITYGEGELRKQFFEEDHKLYYVDQDFFDLFDYTLMDGNRATLLTEPMSIVMTRSMVEKYMPDETQPIGKFLDLDGGWYPGTYKITGILDDLPGNSIYSFDFLMPISDLLKNEQYQDDDGWGWENFTSYILLEEGADKEQVFAQAKDLLNDRNSEEHETSNSSTNLVFTALTDIHLNDLSDEAEAGTTSQTLFFFVIIAVFIISIAWLNYINLATAQALKRAKEVGIRKAVGAGKKHLIAQFMLEAFIINGVAFLIALIISYLSLPLLSRVLDKELSFGTGIEPIFQVYIVLAFVIGTLVSGFYPALVLSRFKPAVVVKGTSFGGEQKFGLRQGLVVLQLVIGVFLISGTLAVFKQLTFMKSRDLGMDVEHVLSMRGPRVYDDREERNNQVKAFKTKLASIPGISEIAGSAAVPGGDFNWGTSMRPEGRDESEAESVKMMWVDANFHNTYGMELIAGRFHQEDLKGESAQVVVNETLVKTFSMGTPEEAVGQKMKVGDRAFLIIGVLKDYHWYSLRQEKEPLLLNYASIGTSNISVKIISEDVRTTMDQIEAEYVAHFPNNPFDFYFMDDYFDRQYQSDQQFGQIFSTFSVIAIIIACLGLFGLASFTLGLRVKEIGVRKVLGASIKSILMMIYKDYMKLILIASAVGLPAIYYIIDYWLENYAYRIAISADLFVVPVVLLVVIALGTVSYQSIRAAVANPISSLRTE
ncbi:MAG: ABC transporter permease [Cyclobacteriaceae bacterium]